MGGHWATEGLDLNRFFVAIYNERQRRFYIPASGNEKGIYANLGVLLDLWSKSQKELRAYSLNKKPITEEVLNKLALYVIKKSMTEELRRQIFDIHLRKNKHQ